MSDKTSVFHSALRTVVQAAIRRERQGWPPDSLFGAYQPRRPDTPLPKTADEKKRKPY